jgi:hypothetical protein
MGRQKPERVRFIDVKGIGRPSNFTNDMRQFPSWSFKLGNFLEGSVKGMKGALECAQDQDEDADSEELRAILPEGVDPEEAGRQLFTVLAQLCEGESLDLVQTTQRSGGWAAWRAIAKRVDPTGIGRWRSIMSKLLQPGSFAVKDLTSALVKWEDQVRMYERRTSKELPGDVKASILTEMTQGRRARSKTT